MDIQGFDQRMTAVVGSVAGVRNHDNFYLKERLGKSKIHLFGENKVEPKPKTWGVGGAVVNSDEEKLLDYGDQPPLLPPKREGLILIFFSNQGWSLY